MFTKREQFARDGFYVFENILDSVLVDRLQRFSDDVLSEQELEHFEMHRTNREYGHDRLDYGVSVSGDG